MNKQQVKNDIDAVIVSLIKWSIHLDKQDSGGYCENSSDAFNKSLKVIVDLISLRAVLTEYED